MPICVEEWTLEFYNIKVLLKILTKEFCGQLPLNMTVVTTQLLQMDGESGNGLALNLKIKDSEDLCL